MTFYETGFWIWWRKYGDHLTAPLILIALIILGSMLFKEQELKRNISQNCGWGEHDYYCYCEKSESMEIKNKIENHYGGEMPNIIINNSGGVDDAALDG